MSKKKGEEPVKKIKLGRPGNTLKMGIVGMANVGIENVWYFLGKSTTFNVLCKLNVPAENYPFCTIDPNTAKVPVPDERFDKLCKMFKPKSEVAAVLSIVDIAGYTWILMLVWYQEPTRVRVWETRSCHTFAKLMPFFKWFEHSTTQMYHTLRLTSIQSEIWKSFSPNWCWKILSTAKSVWMNWPPGWNGRVTRKRLMRRKPSIKC